MTLPEWTAAITAELRTAGFTVEEYQGFPLAKVPLNKGINGHLERVRFLKFHTTLPAQRRIYQEGCLFLPACGDAPEVDAQIWQMAKARKPGARVRITNDNLGHAGRVGIITEFFVLNPPHSALVKLDDGGENSGDFCKVSLSRLTLEAHGA
jgi:hypothetical protein